jgi:hypothetical protein
MGSWVCTAESWLQGASGFFALTAAIIWLRASRTKTPTTLTYGNINDLTAGLLKQSRLNAWAALFAAGAATLQVPLAFMPTCWSNTPWFLSN